jgi:RNA polymerase sigma-70 factor (ECF subfamily)
MLMRERYCMVGLTAERNMQKTASMDDIPRLVEAARKDPAAFGRLYNHFVQPVYRYLYSHVGTVHDAEDLTSQTFMTAYESLPRYRERGYFSAWLFRIARSRMVDHFRGSRREVGLQAVERIKATHDALGQVIQDEELNRLNALVYELTEEEQDLIRLRYIADLSFAEMADLLGKREDAVKKSVYRLLARLKSQME